LVEEISYGIIPIKRDFDGVKVLLVQHRAGHWAFPKGHPNPDEKPIETAQRELLEETGLSIVDFVLEDPLCESYSFNLNGVQVHKKVCYYLAEVTGNVVLQAEELADSRWLSPERLAELATFPESQKLCESVRKLFS
jgi:bis(5'-nucleosidyl)-tetraphosphatase